MESGESIVQPTSKRRITGTKRSMEMHEGSKSFRQTLCVSILIKESHRMLFGKGMEGLNAAAPAGRGDSKKHAAGESQRSRTLRERFGAVSLCQTLRIWSRRDAEHHSLTCPQVSLSVRHEQTIASMVSTPSAQHELYRDVYHHHQLMRKTSQAHARERKMAAGSQMWLTQTHGVEEMGVVAVWWIPMVSASFDVGRPPNIPQLPGPAAGCPVWRSLSRCWQNVFLVY